MLVPVIVPATVVGNTFINVVAERVQPSADVAVAV